MVDDPPTTRLTFERLGDDFAELAQPNPTAFAASAGRGLDNPLHWQILRQLARTTRRTNELFLRWGRCNLGPGLFLGLADMTKLKLSAVPDDKPVKISIELPAAVHRDLIVYAEALGRKAERRASRLASQPG
jgi:hypothetical protein